MGDAGAGVPTDRRTMAALPGAVKLGEHVRGADAVRRHAQAVNELPHPQVVFAFGLRITNCAPESCST